MRDELLRVLIYARVSSPSQKRKANALQDEPSLSEQRQAMRDVATGRGWHVVREVEDVLTGSVPVRERPSGAVLYDLATGRSIDLVMVYDNDRIGRDQDAVVAKVFRADMRSLGIQLFSVHQPVEPKAPADYQPYEDDSALWLESVSDTASSVFIRQFRRRHAFGMRNRVLVKKLMAGCCPTGYLAKRHSLPNGRMFLGERFIDPEFGPIIKRIFDEYESGLSCVRIAGLLNREGKRTPTGTLWIESTIRGIINNPCYYGAAVYRRGKSQRSPEFGKYLRLRRPESEWLVSENAQHPAIVPKEQWERCQAIKRAKKPAPRTYGESSLLSGLVRCGKCGSPMYKNSGWRGGYYGCRLFRATLKQQCERNSIRREELEAEVLRQLQSIAAAPDVSKELALWVTDDERHQLTAEREQVLAALEQLANRLQKARDAYEAGIDTLTEYAVRKSEVEAERTLLTEQRTKVEQRLGSDPTDEEICRQFTLLFSDVELGFRARPLHTQKLLLRQLIACVEVVDREIRIVLHDGPA